MKSHSLEEKYLGKRYTTGNLAFQVFRVTPVTNYFAKLEFQLLDAGYFSSCLLTFGSDELEQGLSSGQIWVEPVLDAEKVMVENNFDLDQ